MEPLAALLADTFPAQAMRTGRWIYAGVSTAHLLGLALLVGAIAALDLRLIGCWPGQPLAPLARVLQGVAGTGLALAVTSGMLLFLAAPANYLAQPLFAAKLALVAAGTAHALFFRWRGMGTAPARLRRIGAVSLSFWLTALVAGRMLAFVD